MFACFVVGFAQSTTLPKMKFLKFFDRFLPPDQYEKLWELESMSALDPLLDPQTFMNTKLYYCDWLEYSRYVLLCERHLRRVDTTRRTLSYYFNLLPNEPRLPPRYKLLIEILKRDRKVLHLSGHIFFEWLHNECTDLTKFTRKTGFFYDPLGCLKYCYRRRFLRTEHEVVNMIASHLIGMLAEKLWIGNVDVKNKDCAWVAVYASKLVSISAIQMTLQGTLQPNSVRITLHHWIRRGFDIASNFLLANGEKFLMLHFSIKESCKLDKAKLQELLGEQVYNRRPIRIELIEGGVIKGPHNVK